MHRTIWVLALLSVLGGLPLACGQNPMNPSPAPTPTPTSTLSPTPTFTPTITPTPYGEVLFQFHTGGDYDPTNVNTDVPVTVSYLDNSGVTQTQPATVTCYNKWGSTTVVSYFNTPLHGNYFLQVVYPGSDDWCQYYGAGPNYQGINSVNFYDEAVYGASYTILATCSQNVTFIAPNWTVASATPITISCSGSVP